MEIRQNKSTAPVFGKMYINSSKMNRAQDILSEKVAERLSLSTAYRNADNKNIDIYILPHYKDPQAVSIRFMNGWTDNYYRSNGRILQTGGQKNESIKNIVNRVNKQLNKILCGEIKYPVSLSKDSEHTDLRDLRPGLFEK